jgi:hypothetical protein
MAHHPGGAARRHEQGDQHLDGGRLAGAIGAQQAEQLARPHGEGDAAHGGHVQAPAADDAGVGAVGAGEVDRLDRVLSSRLGGVAHGGRIVAQQLV